MHTRRHIAQHQMTCAGLLAATIVLLSSSGAFAQVSQEEHLKHHPPQPGATASASPGGMMGDMGEMMKSMTLPTPRELYPSLMALPELTLERRQQIERDAEERIRSGTQLMDDSLGALAAANAAADFRGMEEALTSLREGVARFESGIAAKHALTEGRAPREVALEWFKREMNLPGATSLPVRHGFGGSAFHIVVIAILAAFAASMIWLYFARMRRATALLQGLTGATQAAPRPAAPISALPQVTPAKKWSGNLRAAAIFQETPDVKTFRLMNPVGGALPFDFLPGQFTTVTVPLEGKAVKRSYTIASSPTQHDYIEITVKREETGQVSAFLHDQVKVGDLLEFSGPSGAFTFTGTECNCILLIAGGVGITPLMSVLRYLMDRSWSGDIFLLYSIGHPEDFIFREEIEYLQRRHPKLRVAVTVSRAEGTDWKGARGRISKELVLQTVPDVAKRYVHVCGPVPMMEAMKQLLGDLGVPKGRVKTEAFGPVLGKPEPIQPTLVTETAGTRLPTVNFSLSDKSAPLPPDKTVLDVADALGVYIDNSCRVGTCGTCRVKLLKGKVTMEVQDGLEPGDREKNIILACQAKSTGNITVEA
jgi:ferredoxin-NADP reductase